MNPQAHQPVLHGSKPRAGGNVVSARKKERGQYEGGMKLQMFQFVFICIAFHYGVEMNGYKTTVNAERKSGASRAL